MTPALHMLRRNDADQLTPLAVPLLLAPRCRLIAELSPAVLGREITARPVRPRRVPHPDRASDPDAPKTKVVRKPEPGTMSQDELARWPQCCRPGGYYLEGKPIPVPPY
jgi:hypothetical protein